jgi:serine/threonine protein kinase
METASSLLETLRENRLLQPDQLEELSPTVLARFADARSLAKYLLQRGWLTVYQVNQLFQGNAADLVLGPYRILDRLGEGGVSQVFKAWDTRRKCVAAVKVLRTEHLNNAEAVGRFRREMQVIAQLNHPNIVRAFDVDLSGARHYFAMEYVEGVTLDKLVQLAGPLPPSQAAFYIRQAAMGLQHAHERGLVHRDIKPGNLLITTGGSLLKILDLGMSLLKQSEQPQEPSTRLTVEGILIGTPDYLAPEQATDPRHVDIRADVYSLGCTLFYLLAGEPPFPGGSLLQKLDKHRTEKPAVANLVVDREHRILTAIVEKMMAKRPEDRYQTPAEAAAALWLRHN